MLNAHFQTIEVPWGEVHRLKRSEKEIPIGGAPRALSALWMADGELSEGRIICGFGSSFTMLVRLKDDDHVEAFSLVPYGSSEIPSSPHYADQMELKSRGELKKAWYYRQDVLDHAEARRVVKK